MGVPSEFCDPNLSFGNMLVPEFCDFFDDVSQPVFFGADALSHHSLTTLCITIVMNCDYVKYESFVGPVIFEPEFHGAQIVDVWNCNSTHDKLRIRVRISDSFVLAHPRFVPVKIGA